MNMSYCAVENTAGAMRQVIDLIEEFDTIEEWVASLDEYERNGLERLIGCCEEFAIYSNEIEEAVDNTVA